MAISEDLRSVQATLMQGLNLDNAPLLRLVCSNLQSMRSRSNPLRTSHWRRGISPEKSDAAGENDAPLVRRNGSGLHCNCS